MDLDLVQERGLQPLFNQGGDPVVIENNEDYKLDGLQRQSNVPLWGRAMQQLKGPSPSAG